MSTAAPEKYNPFADLAPDEGEERGARAQLAALGRAAEGMGFPRRDAAEVAVKRQRGADSAVHQFTMRVRVKDSNKFVLFCEKHRLPYREGFDKLVQMIDQIDMGN